MSTRSPKPKEAGWTPSSGLEYAIYHVFLPADPDGSTELPGRVADVESLTRAAHVAAQTCSEIADEALKPQWCRIVKMLNNLRTFLRPDGCDQDQVISQLSGMETRDILLLFSRHRDVAVVFAKQTNCILYQSLRYFGNPHCVVLIPNEVFNNQFFQPELATFLHRRVGSPELLTSILRGVGYDTEVPNIIKHVRSYYRLGHSTRSLLLFLIKAVTCTFLDQADLGRVWYKFFMLRFMCNLAMDAVDADLSSHLLHAISCKILRRLGKLGHSAPKWLHDDVLKTNANLRNTLEARWNEVQAAQTPASLWNPSQLHLEEDVQLSLLGSKEYICNSLMNHHSQSHVFPFSPEYIPRGTLSDFLSSNGSLFDEAYRVDPYIALYDVERAVEQEIDDWVARVTDVEQACVQLMILMEKYRTCAEDVYEHNPEHMSIGLLTMIELWVALDKLVVEVVPTFAECWGPGYHGEMLLKKSLFGKATSLHRLRHASQYLSARRPRSWAHSIISEESIKDIFAVHYHVNSPGHGSSASALRDVIGAEDAERHKRAIVAVLELQGPRFLYTWFSATTSLLGAPDKIDKLMCAVSHSKRSRCTVQHFWFRDTNRILLMCTKRWIYSWSMALREASLFARSQSRLCEDEAWSQYPIAQKLHKYVHATHHTSNGVLAAQAKCSIDLSSHEFTAFGHLRSGGSLQWVNILQQLRNRTLNFRLHSVYFLLAKAVLEVGWFDPDMAKWEWHQELQESSFCYAFLDEVKDLLAEVSGCLQDVTMMSTIILLLTRLLASSPSEDVSERVVGLLRGIRMDLLRCVQELSYDVMMSPTNVERKDHLRDIALTCRSTFDVDPHVAHKHICSAEDIGALLSCGILIRANWPAGLKNISFFSRLLLERDRRLSLALEDVLKDVISAHSPNLGVDLAVCSVWYGYHSGPRVWQALPRPNSHWLTCETAAAQGKILHLNLRHGTLLVDGKTMDGLPVEIRRQRTYLRIFGDQRFLVVSSGIPGMDFCTLGMICEHRVHFALRDDNLVIQAQYKDDRDILEMISHEQLQGDLPAAFINGHVHWLNLSTSVIEIRPLKKLWEEASENWKIDCTSGQFRMFKGVEWLVDIRSPIYDMISKRLECLDVRKNLIVTQSPGPADVRQPSTTRRLVVILSRYGLSFFLNDDGELESRDFKSMVCDENQDIGTLFGLENRLVLRPKSQVEGLTHRCIIIPDGPVSRVEDRHHARITITSLTAKGFSAPVRYHACHVNTDLGCLSSIGGWTSRLCLAKLHALTSVDWMPDPLTGRTGIQQALCLLQSECRSVMAPNSKTLVQNFRGPDSRVYWMHPQLRFAAEEIAYRIDRDHFLCSDTVPDGNTSLKRQPQSNELDLPRTAYLFLFAEVGALQTPTVTDSAPAFLSAKRLELAHHVVQKGHRTLGRVSWYTNNGPLHKDGLAHTMSLAVCHWLIRMGGWTESRDDTEFRNVPWTNSDCLPPWIAQPNDRWQKCQLDQQPGIMEPSVSEVEAILQHAVEMRQRFRLLFLFPVIIHSLAHPDTAFLSILVALAKQSPLKDPPCYECSPLDGFWHPSRGAVRDCYTNTQRSNLALRHSRDIDDKVHLLLEDWSFIVLLAILFRAFFITLVISYHAYMNAELRLLLLRCYRNLELARDLTHRLMKIHTLWGLAQSSPQAPLQPPLGPYNDIVEYMKVFVHSLTDLCTAPCLAQSAGDSPDVSFQDHCEQVMLVQLLRVRSPPELPTPQSRLEIHYSARGNSQSDPDRTHRLNQLFSSLRISETDPTFQQQYSTRLHLSANEVSRTRDGPAENPSFEELCQHYSLCRDKFSIALEMLKKTLGPLDDSHAQGLHQSGKWPPTTAHILLQCLASTFPIKISDDWKKCLLSLALLLVQLQRSRRLLWFFLHDLGEELLRELENEGCEGWSTEERPDWLLIQVEGNFIIRGIQADVAVKMISPKHGENTAMQVSMGEGKSSVILPICAASLADGSQLVRTIVPKPLMAQTSRILYDRLGGLVNRPIYRLPFSRCLLSGPRAPIRVEKMHELLSECMHDRGILLVQPEHVLSLKLTGLEGQLPKGLRGNNGNLRRDSAGALLQLQKWVHCYARDILDESDDILHPRLQLMYTIGPPRHTQGSPDRWVIIQEVFKLVRRHALSLACSLPDALECECHTSGSFPRIRILCAPDARLHLIQMIMHNVMNGHLSSFRLRDINHEQPLCAAVRDFICSKDICRQEADMVEDYGRRNGLWDGLLLLRGLLAYDILWFSLAGRRWRVDYGLSPARTKLAVPYRAKDAPAPEAEFGHPDITIALTCLSYYYGGLTEEQLKASFEILQEQDEPTAEYTNWLSDFEPGPVPRPIENLNNVSIKSSEQWDRYIFPLFSHNQGAVDFYLSRVVFPRETKEFPWKLAASSWDIAEKRERPITGFSGTNDGQYLMPTSIRQLELDHQQGTDVRMLHYLLQPENSSYMLISRPNGERWTIPELLKRVVDQIPRIRVLLDVGAQILDFSNYQLAEMWLCISPGSDGAVYFNDEDELMVLTKDGTCRSLLSSAFAQRLDRCVVYLDDAHTRGTDLKFPPGSRAAVTIGPRVTKDRLVQGCMRMRKLGHGHSVMFLAPSEVDRSIRSLRAKEDVNTPVTTTDVLLWTIHETWADIQRRVPYFAQQGINHGYRYNAWSRFCSSKLTGEKLARAWLQPELKSLDDLYAPFQPKTAPDCSNALDGHPALKRRCRELGVQQLPKEQLEEQEREVHRELEREREVQKGVSEVEPLGHKLHSAVVTFVRTGVIPSWFVGTVFRPVFSTLKGSSAAAMRTRPGSPLVFATSDFCRTVKLVSRQGNMDLYQRPVQWVLSGRWNGNRVLVVLSPFEADGLLPDIRASERVHLHLYTPRTFEHMIPADDLKFYSIPTLPDDWMPPWDLIDQLNVFAGQLYLRDYESYLRLYRFLRIRNDDSPRDSGAMVRRNLADSRVLQKIRNMFTKPSSMLPFVRQLLSIRRGDVSFARSHMGRILRGERLTEEDFKTTPQPKLDHYYNRLPEEGSNGLANCYS